MAPQRGVFTLVVVTSSSIPNRKEIMMRFYATRHQFTCGIDLHARTMYVWILNRDGQMVYHANLPATVETLIETLTPYRDASESGGRGDVVVAVECMFAWYWVADACAKHGIHFVLGHALYMKAIHGGKHKDDKIDAQKNARSRERNANSDPSLVPGHFDSVNRTL